jgi:predicted glycogen debranching enzyme
LKRAVEHVPKHPQQKTMTSFHPNAEWLETDGLGGFASGTISGIRTRRYHALLLAATMPPAGRMVLVNGFDAWVETPDGIFALTSQNYVPGVVHPDGFSRLVNFSHEPWPIWRFEMGTGLVIEQEIFLERETPAILMAWKINGKVDASLRLHVRPFVSVRDFHALHHENGAFQFAAVQEGERISWRPYSGAPGVDAQSNGIYRHEPCWYRNFLYGEEQARGLDAIEDLASPGVFSWELENKPAVLAFSTAAEKPRSVIPIDEWYLEARKAESIRRLAFASPLDRAADAYVARRKEGKTLIAGYPWFGDWGRDTFIALRGLCIATGRLDDARDILLAWAETVSEGMLPNRFPDKGEQPEYNSVDASLWYIVAVHDYLSESQRLGTALSAADRRQLHDAVNAILEGYSQGTRFGIKLDDDGLLAAGEPGVQLTWMDAKIGDWVVTPRTGKPVEVNALWLNALWIGGSQLSKWSDLFEFGRRAFRFRFWDETLGHLHDVIDCDHRKGEVDSSFRPNQILAVGGLPLNLLEDGQAERVVNAVEERLLTPLGLRSLAPMEPGYKSHYLGGMSERDARYHQGTVWPWLIGPFVEAWLRVHGVTEQSRRSARERFIAPLVAHLEEAGLGHISEIADADAPHTPRGCPFQAWSLGEMLRLRKLL